jgi:hypothetical protein
MARRARDLAVRPVQRISGAVVIETGDAEGPVPVTRVTRPVLELAGVRIGGSVTVGARAAETHAEAARGSPRWLGIRVAVQAGDGHMGALQHE